MKSILILPCVFTIISALPELPLRNFPSGPPSAPAHIQQLPRQIGPTGFAPDSRNTYAKPAQTYGPPSLPPVVTKSVYVHLPPEDEEDLRLPQVIQPQPPRKHYKLIFIKAPEPPRYTAPVIPPTPQDEHKTLVYVLVKKPDEQPQIDIPNVAPTEPSKPEVFFIKYKTPEKPTQGYGPPKPEYGTPNSEYNSPAF